MVSFSMSFCTGRPLLASVVLGMSTIGCGIPENDPLPGFGARCVVSEGGCDLEHVCVPEVPSQTAGTCVPVQSFGACEAPTHPPGRRGEVKDATEILISGPEDLALLEDLRVVTGQVRAFNQGVGNVDIPDLCAFRALQKTGDGLGIGDSTITSLDGLNSVTAVEGGLAIFDNPDLTSLDGLENLVFLTPRPVDDFTSFEIIIAGNDSLEDSVVDAFLADLSTRLGRQPQAVACANGGRPCLPDEQQLLDDLVVNGLRADP